MRLLSIITLSLFYSCIATAKSNYQIDLIVFAVQTANTQDVKLSSDSPLIPITANAISLKAASGKEVKPYSLLPRSYSRLNDQYYLLSRKSGYPVLGHYSWRQPVNSKSKVALPLAEAKGWQMQGTFRVTDGVYYSFDANLQVSPPSNPHSSFAVTQKQRLKENTLYYLDNERIGMVVKIHKVA